VDGVENASVLATGTGGADEAAGETALSEDASGSEEIVIENPVAIADGPKGGAEGASRLAGKMGEEDETAESSANPEEQLEDEGNKIARHSKDASANASERDELAASAPTNDECDGTERAGGSSPDRGGGDHAATEVAGQAEESPAVAIDSNVVGKKVDNEGEAKAEKAKAKKRGELVGDFVAIALQHHV
jgi:hypothetical protein